MTNRDRIVTLLLVVAAVLSAVPGVHALEPRMGRAPAVLLTHGLAVLLLAAAFVRWRSRRAR